MTMNHLKAKVVLLALTAAVALAVGAVDVDGIVATVGDTAILYNDVVEEMRRAGLGKDRFRDALDHLIDRKLILKAAADSKLTMQDWLVENRVREITESMFGGDQNRLKAALAQQKLPYVEWRKNIKDDLVVGAMRWNVIDRNVSASPSEMRAEFAAHPEKYRAAGTVSVSVILLKPDDAELKPVVRQALKGTDFAELARKYSADAHASEGGVWKDVKPEDEFHPDICAALAKLSDGEVSDWIELEDGSACLVRKDSTAAERTLSFAEAYDRVEAVVKNANAKKLYQEWIARLREAAYIKYY